MTDSLITHFSGGEKEVTTASKKDQQFAMLSQNKYQFEHYLLEETNSIESDNDIVSSSVNITGSNSDTEKVVVTSDYQSESCNKSSNLTVLDSHKFAAMLQQPNVFNHIEYMLMQKMLKLDLVLESMQQTKMSQEKSVGTPNKEIQMITNKFIQERYLETEYFRIVKDNSCYKLYFNIDKSSISIEHIKQLVKSIESKRNILFNKVFINREIILDRDMNSTVKNESPHKEDMSLTINYKI